MGSLENVESDKSANNYSKSEVEVYDLENEHSEELEEFDEDGNLVVVQDEVDLQVIVISTNLFYIVEVSKS